MLRTKRTSRWFKLAIKITQIKNLCKQTNQSNQIPKQVLTTTRLIPLSKIAQKDSSLNKPNNYVFRAQNPVLNVLDLLEIAHLARKDSISMTPHVSKCALKENLLIMIHLHVKVALPHVHSVWVQQQTIAHLALKACFSTLNNQHVITIAQNVSMQT